MNLEKLTFKRDNGDIVELSRDEAQRLFVELETLFGRGPLFQPSNIVDEVKMVSTWDFDE